MTQPVTGVARAIVKKIAQFGAWLEGKIHRLKGGPVELRPHTLVYDGLIVARFFTVPTVVAFSEVIRRMGAPAFMGMPQIEPVVLRHGVMLRRCDFRQWIERSAEVDGYVERRDFTLTTERGDVVLVGAWPVSFHLEKSSIEDDHEIKIDSLTLDVQDAIVDGMSVLDSSIEKMKNPVPDSVRESSC
jgi:hypothetical protein